MTTVMIRRFWHDDDANNMVMIKYDGDDVANDVDDDDNDEDDWEGRNNSPFATRVKTQLAKPKLK